MKRKSFCLTSTQFSFSSSQDARRVDNADILKDFIWHLNALKPTKKKNPFKIIFYFSLSFVSMNKYWNGFIPQCLFCANESRTLANSKRNKKTKKQMKRRNTSETIHYFPPPPITCSETRFQKGRGCGRAFSDPPWGHCPGWFLPPFRTWEQWSSQWLALARLCYQENLPLWDTWSQVQTNIITSVQSIQQDTSAWKCI